MRSVSRPLALTVASALLLAACAGTGASPTASGPASTASPATTTDPSSEPAPSAVLGGTLTIYSGRSEELVGPLIEAEA